MAARRKEESWRGGCAAARTPHHRLEHPRIAVDLGRHGDALQRVFNEYAERFKDRPGGYTRIYKTGYRPGDNAPMAVIELLGTPLPAVERGPAADEIATPAADADADAAS